MANDSSTESNDATGSNILISHLPSSLTFLIANFQSFVTIKLESGNYFAWKTQIESALRANSLFQYVDGSFIIPPQFLVNESGVQNLNPEYENWLAIDRMLVSCVIATLSPSILSYINSIQHAFQIWKMLEGKFSALSRSHVHDLKRRLFHLKKNTSMEAYLDSIKEIVQKLSVSGNYIEKEDLVFHTLNGLDGEFSSLKTAIRTRSESISFSDLASILMAEDLHMTQEHSSQIDPAKLLIAQQNLSSSSSTAQPNTTVPVLVQLPQVQSPQFYTQMQSQFSNQFYNNGNRNNRNGNNKFRRNQNQFTRGGFSSTVFFL